MNRYGLSPEASRILSQKMADLAQSGTRDQMLELWLEYEKMQSLAEKHQISLHPAGIYSYVSTNVFDGVRLLTRAQHNAAIRNYERTHPNGDGQEPL